jgi:hypothetical protein
MGLRTNLKVWGNATGVPQNRGGSMNEYLALELIRQRSSERREEARRAGLARTLRLARRRRDKEDALLARPVPDYVDGTFGPGDDLVHTRHVSATR